MYHYLFTNDLRISNLEEILKKTGKAYVTNTVPSSTEDKSENNNMTTLGFYFNLTQTSRCAMACSNGHVRDVVLNFIKKFQFPNPRTQDSLNDCIADNISVAPMRIILKILYFMSLQYPEQAHLSRQEILDFIFYNSDVAKSKNADIFALIGQIITFRETNVLPPNVDQDPTHRNWKHEERQIREMTKVLTWSGCASENEKNEIVIQHSNLTTENKALIFDILNYKGFWTPQDGASYEQNRASYQAYMDLSDSEFDSLGTTDARIDYTEAYRFFNDNYSVKVLNNLEDKELVNRLFASKEYAQANNLPPGFFIWAEHGNIKSGDIPFGKAKASGMTGVLVKNDGDCYIYEYEGQGRSKKSKISVIDEQTAISLANLTKEALKEIVEHIATIQLETTSDYKELLIWIKQYLSKLNETRLYWSSIGEPSALLIKYLHCSFPDKFACWYSKEKLRTMVAKVYPSSEVEDDAFVLNGQLSLYANKIGVDNANLSVEDLEQALAQGENIILYGVPGSGKSYKIKQEYCSDEQFMERIIFHPDYTYSDFVGQILPQNIEGNISYPFVPGPFTRILKKAVEDVQHNYFLIIEEINRGNAPAIFGEIFQLLDRASGESEYGINNPDIAQEVYGDPEHLVRIPRNLFLLATMNTSDQNVFTLDTAFKRRWKMQSIPNDISKCQYAEDNICGTTVTWANFLRTINDKIIEFGKDGIANEDKRLGVFFLRKDELSNEDAFSEKILMYLWNDAFKYTPEKVFKPEYKTLEQLIDGFKDKKFEIFVDAFVFKDNPVEG